MNCAYCQNIVLKLFNQLVQNGVEIVVWNRKTQYSSSQVMASPFINSKIESLRKPGEASKETRRGRIGQSYDVVMWFLTYLPCDIHAHLVKRACSVIT
jgi:hypothetical protein